MKSEKRSACGKALMFIGGAVLTVAGIVAVSALIDRYAGKACSMPGGERDTGSDKMTPDRKTKEG